MKKFNKIFFNLFLLFSLYTQAQVGIGTTNPEQSSILHLEAPDQALLLTRVANVNVITNPVNGMFVYDLSTHCFRGYQNGVWSGCLASATTGTIATLTCASAVNTGTLTASIPASGVSSSIPYTGGNGGNYNGLIIESTGVLGLTATLATGNFANGSGNLNFIITGTAISSGTASFLINIGGRTCTFTRTVLPAPPTVSALLCGSITYDNPYYMGYIYRVPKTYITVPYTGGNGSSFTISVSSTGVTGLTAASTGTLAVGSGNLILSVTGNPSSSSGTATFTLNFGGHTCVIDLPVVPVGTVTTLNCAGAIHTGTLGAGVPAASGTSTEVPYTGGNGGYYPNINVPSTGITGLTATLSSGNLAVGNGSLIFTITGTPSGVGTASFPINIGGTSCTFTRTITASGTITSINCGSGIRNGTLINGLPASGVNGTIPYAGGNGGAHTGQIVNSTGVTGLTLTINPGTFASGAGSVSYTVSGTPTGSGTASFAINIGGRTCTLNLTVLPAAAITTLNCAGATHNGSLFHSVAASGVNSVISYTGGNGGGYTAISVNSTGVTGLTASIAAGTLNVGAGTLTFTITGTPNGIGIASFVITIGGITCTLERVVSPPPVGAIASVNCVGAIHYGSLISGVLATGTSSEISYASGNGGPHTGDIVASTGVTGLTATLLPGNFNLGSGTLNYTITGTPSSSGTATFVINIGGISCTLTRTVVVQGTVATLNCAGAANSGTLNAGVSASGVNTVINYTGGNGGSYYGQTISSTGVTGLTATLAAGSFNSGSGSVTLTITGTPSGAGTASFNINIGGVICTFTRTVLP